MSRQVLNAPLPGFSVDVESDTALFRFTRSPLFASADLSHKERLLTGLKKAERDGSVSAIVLLGSPEKSGREEYVEPDHSNRWEKSQS